MLALDQVHRTLHAGYRHGFDRAHRRPELKALMAKDYRRWGEIIRKRNIRAE